MTWNFSKLITISSPSPIPLSLNDCPCLFSGAPHHIELKSLAFDSPEKKQEHTTKVLVNCYLSAPLHACVCDKVGNKTPLKTILSLSWLPGSSGQPTSKKTSSRGEAIFPADSLKCNSPRVDQEIRIKAFSPEHRTLQVKQLGVLYYFSIIMSHVVLQAVFKRWYAKVFIDNIWSMWNES